VAALVFDAGGLIALDRGKREVGTLLAVAADTGVEAVTSAACVAQAWRDPARQARLARALAGFLERSLDPSAARDCGLLLARSHTSDIADAAITLLVENGDTVVTSDPDDLAHLLNTVGTPARVLSV
jgi:xanthine/CO dehydrogenase XdhC/CoxF family maturation factor